MAEKPTSQKVLDADGAIFGRLCSTVAKQLLNGEKIIIVNAEKAIITGNPKHIKKKFLEARHRGNWKKGPFNPRYPDRIIHRCIRGMIPYKKPKGKKALSGLKIYIGCPEDYIGRGEKNIKKMEDIECRFITIGDVSKFLGAKYE